MAFISFLDSLLLNDDLSALLGERRSSCDDDVLTCATKRTRTHLGDRSFSVAGPSLWDSLPVALRDREISFVQFQRLLKKKNLGLSRAAAHSDWCFSAPCINILTYLLTSSEK